ncbi:uncharacterized protein [Anas platyrhynchos]|uniref:uncharacterized protein isoform X2 n=1 Tax=Anas platyrhynchos TaxID=8839 RepID=UPI003AF28D23
MGNLLYGNLFSCELVRMGNDHEDESWSWAGKCSGRARGGVEASWAWQVLRGRESLLGMAKSCAGQPAWLQSLQSSPRCRRGAGQPLGRNPRCPRSPSNRPTLQPPWQVQQPAPAPPGAAALLASPAPQSSAQRPFSHRGFPQMASAASADAKLPLRRPSRAANGGCLAASLPPRSDGAALAAPAGPPLREQALPAPRTLSSSRGQLPEPCLHAVGLSEDQGPPLPGPTPPEPAQAPATASTQTATPDAATLAEVPEEPLELLELGPDAFAEAFPQLAGDSQQLQHLQDQLPADLDSSGLEELLSCLDAVEPQDAFAAVPSSPVLKRFLSQLPDLCEDIEEPSTQGLAATRALGEVPSSPGLHPDKVQAGRALQPPAAAVPPLSSPLKPAARPQLRRALPKRPPLQEFIPARRRTLPQPPLAPLKRRPNPDCLPARKRPLPQPPQAPVQSPPDPDFLTALRRALPKPRLSPLQSPPDPARRRPMPKPLPKRPPQQEFIPARKRTLPQPPLAPLKRPQLLPALRRALPSPPRSPLQSPPPAPAPTGTKWGAKRPAPTSTPSTAQSSQHRQLRLPGSSAVPAAPRLLASRKAQALPAPPGSTAAARKAPLKQAPRALGLPAAGGQAQRLALPTQPRTLQRPAQPRGDYVPCVGPWAGGDAAPTPLEEQESSVPITPQQRPERERLKKLAQEERQRAAHHMRIGPGQFFEQRQKDHARAYSYGYP